MDISLRACGRAAVLAVAFAVFSSCGAYAAPVNVVHAFDDASDGLRPVAQFFDAQGNLYGFTAYGGDSTVCANGCGTVFKIAPDGTKTVLHTFKADGSDGTVPIGLVTDSKGDLYGATAGGGRFGFGAVFEVFPSGREKIVYAFKATHFGKHAPHGIWPLSGPIIGKDGNLYGTTWHGGIRAEGCGEGGCGTVYRLTPKGALTTLYAFKGPGDGCQATSGLTADPAGNLYGTTEGCGHGNYGTVYKIDPSGNETILHTFAEGADGNDPISPPVFDKDGNLFGGTTYGGSPGCNGGGGCGIIYKIAADGTYSVFYSFANMIDGFSPMGTLYIDKTGDIYGTTFMGGATHACNYPLGCGTAFKLSPDATLTTLHQFVGINHDDGEFVPTGIIPSPSHKLFYGSANDGPGCCGMVFSLGK